MKIVFYDAASPAAYSDVTLDAPVSGIGGAEMSLIRVATGLAGNHDVAVVQSRRTSGESAVSGGVRWVPVAEAGDVLRDADVVVVQRRIGDVLRVRRRNRTARVFVWYHDWYFHEAAGPLHRRVLSSLKADARKAIHLVSGAVGLAVSATHLRNIREHLGEALLLRSHDPELAVVHNMVVLPPASVGGDAVDVDKLVFFSAAWKGLDQVLRTFREVRREIPGLRLHVASPGYGTGDPQERADGVVPMGYLPHPALFEEVRSSLCVFYPADQVPETFGLVFAESHALGTPVLAHDFGAAAEMLSPEELVDARDIAGIVEKLRRWRAGRRPEVSLHEEFQPSNVLSRWEELLAERLR